MEKSKKSVIKDVTILLSVFAPLLFIIIGGSIYLNNGFDGTLMEKLFPAIFFGFIASFASMTIISNVFKKSQLLWIITSVLIFAITVIVYMLELTNFLVIEFIIVSCSICVLCLIKIIIDYFTKKKY